MCVTKGNRAAAFGQVVLFLRWLMDLGCCDARKWDSVSVQRLRSKLKMGEMARVASIAVQTGAVYRSVRAD